MIKWQDYYNALNQAEKDIVDVLSKILKEEDPKTILEIGSGWGVTARCFVEQSEAFLLSIDKSPTLSYKGPGNCFKDRLEGFEDRFQQTTADSKSFLPALQNHYPFIYIDGDHSYEGTKTDLLNAFNIVTKGGTIMIDDVKHPKNVSEPEIWGVEKAVQEVVKLKESSIKELKSYEVAYGLVKIKVI